MTPPRRQTERNRIEGTKRPQRGKPRPTRRATGRDRTGRTPQRKQRKQHKHTRRRQEGVHRGGGQRQLHGRKTRQRGKPHRRRKEDPKRSTEDGSGTGQTAGQNPSYPGTPPPSTTGAKQKIRGRDERIPLQRRHDPRRETRRRGHQLGQTGRPEPTSREQQSRQPCPRWQTRTRRSDDRRTGDRRQGQ